MATNEILQFAETDTGTNLLTQAEYLADSQRPIGNQPGVARSKLVNKALRQASLIAAGLAEYIADNQANNITDALTPQNIADCLQAALTGALGVTPPQFDNDTSLATTAFVQRALGNFATVNSIASSLTLNNDFIGQANQIVGTASYTLTLPAAVSVPAGSAIVLENTTGLVQTVVQNGTDFIYVPSAKTSLVLQSGDNVVLVSNGLNGWNVFGGSAGLPFSGLFGSSLTANGYQKLPSGLIIQWGSVVTGTDGAATFVFPVSFPTALLASYAALATGGNPPSAFVGSDPGSNSSVIVRAASAASASAGAGIGIRVLVIGY